MGDETPTSTNLPRVTGDQAAEMAAAIADIMGAVARTIGESPDYAVDLSASYDLAGTATRVHMQAAVYVIASILMAQGRKPSDALGIGVECSRGILREI